MFLKAKKIAKSERFPRFGHLNTYIENKPALHSFPIFISHKKLHLIRADHFLLVKNNN